MTDSLRRPVDGAELRNHSAASPSFAGQHPTDRPTRDNAIEPKRLLSAATIVSEKVGLGQYRVQSRTRRNRVYYIDVYTDQPCDCEDSQFGHGRQCAHWLHCRMREGDELTLLALGQVILRAQRVIAEYLGTEPEE